MRRGGAVTVTADSTNTAIGNSNAGAGGIVAVGVAIPTAVIAAGASAIVNGNVQGGGDLTVQSTAHNNATVRAVPVSVGLFTGADADAHAAITDTAQTVPRVGKNATLTLGGGAAKVNATTTDSAIAKVDMFSVSILFILVIVSAQAYGRRGGP